MEENEKRDEHEPAKPEESERSLEPSEGEDTPPPTDPGVPDGPGKSGGG